MKLLYSVFANNWGEVLLLIKNNSMQLIKVFVTRYFIAVVFIVLILYYNYLLVLQQQSIILNLLFVYLNKMKIAY